MRSISACVHATHNRRATVEVLLNAKAGSASDQDRTQELRQYFDVHDVRATFTIVRNASELVAEARRVLGMKPDVIVAGGGDGTLSAVAGVLAGTAIPFGVLPLGTRNHFARDAGIPADLASAVETVCHGDVIRVDVGRVNGRIFLNNSSLGLYPEAVRIRQGLEPRLRHRKWPATLWAAARVVRRFPFFDVRISLQERVLERRTPLVFIGNNSYQLDGLGIGKRTRLDGGHLAVHIINRTDRMGLIVLAVDALIGRLERARNFETLHATHVELNTHKGRATVATDGEIERLSMPLRYELLRQALSVVVPAAPRPDH